MMAILLAEKYSYEEHVLCLMDCKQIVICIPFCWLQSLEPVSPRGSFWV